MTRVVHRICPFCEACCGLELKVDEGRITAIRGYDEDVHSAGFLCPKATALRDLHEDPDRLRAPLVKRDGKHVEVTWDEAFAEIERRLVPILEKHGRDAVAMVIGNPSVHKLGLTLYTARLTRAIGTTNLFSASTLDQMPKQLSTGLMFGHWLSIAVPDLARTDLLVVIGANPVVSNGSLWTVPDFRGKAKAMQARGGKLVVIDPRRTETAEIADQHLFVRPGGDVFLLLGVVNVLFGERRVRLGRLAELVDGLSELEAAVAEFTPERVAARCGVDAEAIRGLARQPVGARRGVRADRDMDAGVRDADQLVDRCGERADRASRRARRCDVPQGGGVRRQHDRIDGPRQGDRGGPAAEPRVARAGGVGRVS